MEDKIVDLRDCLFQLNISNNIRIKARHAFPPKTQLDEFEKITAIIDVDISNIINQMIKICEEINHEI